MGQRTQDGSAGDADYGAIGSTYSRYRRADPRLAAVIAQALGDARTVLNVGAGAGSYEPTDREVTAVEPSAAMRAQRPSHRAPAVDATAEQLPFADNSFDAAMTTFSVHQWQDQAAGLAELRRVTRGPVVVLTCDPRRVEEFWLREYAPEVLAVEARRYPAMDALADGLGGRVSISTVLIPQGCTDGFTEAYYGRPEQLLDVEAQQACSAWSLVEPAVLDRFTRDLAADLLDGTWDARHGALRTLPAYEGSLVMLVAEPGTES
ncbi:class I SAM-dependent methyltransferase [Brachybacterium saurashtrense]|uniref:Class I SAM-dependent methyltransferase n=1 Tax=Brachybacterium saurashtrense TaxID=556288 RepID=A0A345YLD7_9MICO|nr:class I SAM-dependent methyltransferase [Brachybacterium saurashtrense]AXK44739.1 class I SAM-dependent methyltransferase [Brachybacterium saurashtrense]RRR23351.1 class I SAM-dependent methyltransferase [Brachybacterium saurashtrense]